MLQMEQAEGRIVRSAVTDPSRQMSEARRVIGIMIRALRQTSAYFDGISAMDQVRMKKMLRETIRQSEQFLGG